MNRIALLLLNPQIVTGLWVILLALLIVHFVTRQSNVERRARDLAAFSRELKRRDAILEAISFAAERFLRNASWKDSLPAAIARLGTAAGVSRVAVYEASAGLGVDFRVSQHAEWFDAGVDSKLRTPPITGASLAELGLDRWRDIFLQGHPIMGLVSTFPEGERALLEARGVRSILAIPIRVGDLVWGALIFADHFTEREWPLTEREVLVAAASMIGAAVERTHTEATLWEVEDRFRQMAEHIREVFFMTDAESNEVLYLSPAYEEVWGRSREETMRDPFAFTESILPEDKHIMLSSVAASTAGKGGAERRFEYRIRRPDGAIRWIHNRSFQIYGEGGRPHRVAGVCTDITEQKELEDELRRSNRIEAIGHLAAGIAHEINTPIQYIGGNLEFLDESYGDLIRAIEACRELLDEVEAGPIAPERIAAIAKIFRDTDVDYVLKEAPRASAQALDGVHRVAEIVRAMKDFSHPGTSLKIPTDLNQAIRSTITVARNEWKYVAEMETELDPAMPLVHCLPGELNQAILNLVVNAAHAIADRQHSESNREPGVITVSTAVVDECVEVRVRDTGTGIPAEIHQRIFDPFFTTKEVGRGTGQGLTFVHSIVVDKHGGTVTFVTEPGVGTTFVVRLPNLAEATDLSEAA